MIKFFKKAIPCVLLSACVASSVCLTSACSSGKDYSEDISKLQQQIEDLKNENKSLENQISNITPSDKDYSEEINELKTQLATLKEQNSSYIEESNKLKQQIETLKTDNGSNLEEINKLEQQLTTLKTSNEGNLSEIEKLQQQINTLKSENVQLTEQANNQQLLIESLQNGTSNELKTYKIGDTFTYSYMGVDYFSITLKDRSTLIIKNLSMIDFIPNQTISAKVYITMWNDMYLGNTKIAIGKEFVIEDLYQDYEVLKYAFGYPLGNDGILPYAIFDLTASE